MPTTTTPTKLALKATTLAGASPVHPVGWDLPQKNFDGSWTPGRWQSVKGLVRYRANGLHVCGVDQLGYWQTHLKGKTLVVWVCEYDGHTSIGPHGFAARRVRLLRPWDGREEI